MKYKVEFFKPEEFVCRCCGRGQVAAALVYALDEFRRAWNMPVIVNSGWRCPDRNAAVGGAPSSRHKIGCAADIAPTDEKLIGPFQTLIGYMFGRRDGWEIKMYPRFVHLAVPRDEEGRPWNGGIITGNFTSRKTV